MFAHGSCYLISMIHAPVGPMTNIPNYIIIGATLSRYTNVNKLLNLIKADKTDFDKLLSKKSIKCESTFI